MDVAYDEDQRDWLKRLQDRYRVVADGICMAALESNGTINEKDCRGSLGFRHAISRRHLRLIADGDNMILANKEYGSFDAWSDRDEALQRVPVSRFSAGKWSCQKHDERFGGIDAQRVELGNAENLFKAVYRVVLRQCHLSLARWHAFCAETKSGKDWDLFRRTAFESPASEEAARTAAKEWRSEFQALIGKKRILEERMRKEEWETLDFRALRLESEPAVAGWGCAMRKPDYGRIAAMGFETPSIAPIEMGHMIVIPQEDGHAIITASERGKRIDVAGFASTHECMPGSFSGLKPVKVGAVLRRRIHKRIWRLSELGISESVYRKWSAEEREKGQKWMKWRGRFGRTRPWLEKAPRDLPEFF